MPTNAVNAIIDEILVDPNYLKAEAMCQMARRDYAYVFVDKMVADGTFFSSLRKHCATFGMYITKPEDIQDPVGYLRKAILEAYDLRCPKKR